VKPIIVFDGCRLEMKGNTEAERRRNRREARDKAEEYLRQGNGLMAQRKFSEAVDITPQMAYEFIQLLKQQNVEYYVAPYEADAQLAYLYLTKRVHAVITEDSDLLIFGVKRVLFKMDKAGNGTEVDLERLAEVEELNFKHFTDDMLLACCIVSGCDYLDSIKGVGFKKAHKLVMECGDDIQRILKLVRREGKLTVPLDYEKDFEKALLTFKFQLVFSPTERKLVHLHDPAKHPLGKLLKNYVSLDFLGKQMPDDIAQLIAKGDIDPMSHKRHEPQAVLS